MTQNKKNNKKVISIIIPAYRQANTIREDIFRIKNVLDQVRYGYEIIIVIDGDVDKTLSKLKKIKLSNIKIIGYKNNKGKGYAIRYGMAKAQGDIIAFIDSGMDINPNGISILLEDFEWLAADVIVGSKLHPSSKVNYPFERKVISFLSQIFIKVLFGLNVSDTQVGLKFFRREVIQDVMPRLLVKKFAFDIEILVVSYYLGYNRIYEGPVELDLNFKNSIVSKNLIYVLFHTLIDTLAIFYRLRIMHYYDDSSKRKWKYDPELDFKVNIG